MIRGLPWSGTARSSPHHNFAQEAQLDQGWNPGMSELQLTQETSSFLRWQEGALQVKSALKILDYKLY